MAETSIKTDLLVEEEMNDARLAILMNDASIDQILALDLSLKITAWNRACEAATGIRREEAIGQLFTKIAPRVVDFPHVMEALIISLKGLKSFVPWEKGAYSGGYYEHHFIPLKSPAGVIGVLVVIHDVAHRIKAEQELRRLNQELREKSEELARFNWIASHDLKEPLRKIYTFIEMVATKEGIKLSDTARSNLRRAQSAAQRMGLLTDDIASFTQVSAPNEELGQVDLDELLASVISNHRIAIENSGASIERSGMPVIRAYPNMISLLFSHMLANALKFHAEESIPKISVQYGLVDGEAVKHDHADISASYHRISFTDNGIGIAEEYFGRIFDMFQRLNPQGTYKGTGMGLAICRKIAVAHQGFIEVESMEGKGSTFHCYLKDLG